MKKNPTLRNAIKAAIAVSFVLPQFVFAQDNSDDIEEVVVTGSFIRNSAFTQNSPVDTVTQAELVESGAPNISEFMRDLTYTQDTDTVSNLLAPGGQQGEGARFNLRGVGSNSTLTLIDGMRLLDDTLARNIPEIAIDRLEVVLDGGSALYGSDAVAGVVNIIPVKEFEGFKTRSYYKTTEQGGTEDINNAFMWGHSFDNGISYVGAFEWRKRTPLMYYERPREMKVSSTTAPSGNPGSYVQVFDADPGINYYGGHNGTLDVGNVLTDPSCETFNAGYPEHGEAGNGQPSGHQLPSGQCSWEWTMHHPYLSHQEDFNLYNFASLQATDWLNVSGELRLNYNARDSRGLAIRSYGTNDRSVALIRADHPANPYGVDVAPYSWHVFADAYTHRPSAMDEENNRMNKDRESLNIVKLNANYDIAGSWVGVTSWSKQEYMQMYDVHSIMTARLQEGLAGVGGPNGNEYFNPFASADPRSPYFVDGVTSNSKEMTEWLWYHNSGFRSNLRDMEVFETIVSGDVYDIPFGTIQAALGFQWRNTVDEIIPEPHRAAQQGFDYVMAPMSAAPPEYERYNSEVHAYFLEIQAPLWETVDAQFAVRHESFDTFNLKATTPKVSLRWEALPTLALRASWGESFLAPSAYDARPFIPDQSCGETYVGVDGISGKNLAGGVHCSSGNPTLKPESSVIQNVGFTWEPEGNLNGLSVSLDYQEIEYTDRITSLSYVDTVELQFRQMLNATGIARASYDPTPGSATRAQADAYLATLGVAGATENKIQRYNTGEVQKVYRQPANITSTWIDLYDANASYTTDIRDWGTFSLNLAATYYDRYELEGLTGGVQSALGKQNSNSGIVPPLPQLKSNVRLSWFRGNQSASISTNHYSSVDFDARIVDYYADIRPEPLTAPDEIKGQYITNARYAITLDNLWGQDFVVSGGINNLTDELPQLIGILGGFESRLQSPWGRSYWLSLDWNMR
jgi:iron complex outermembrane recepter protein